MSALPTAFGETNLDVVPTTSDPEGWFDIVVPLAEDLWWLSIEAEKPGVGTGSVTYRPDQVPTDVCLVKLIPARRLTVRFIDSQTSKPVPKVRCAVKILPPTPLEAIRVADDAGTATVADAPEGATSLFVLVDSAEWALAPKEGVAPATQLTFGEPFTIPAASDAAVEIALVGSGVIRGTVIDRTTGISVPGVLVEAAAIGNLQQLFAKGARARATSGKDGEFVLTGLPRCPIHLITLSNEWLCAPDGWDGRPVEGKNKEAFFGTQTLELEREISGWS